MTKQNSKRQRDKKRGVFKGEDVSSTARFFSLRLIIAFALTCVGIYALINILPASILRLINEHTAATLGLVLNAFGIPALTAGDVVSEKGLAFKIIPECTPIFTAGLFMSFVSFNPASMRQKATGLVWGITALYLGNMVRLAATFMISRYDGRLFEVTHVYLGQVFTLFLVILCCILWMRWVEKGEEKQGTSTDTARFLARFGLISAVLFLVWIKVHHGYIRVLDWLMDLGFSLFGRTARLAHETAVYYETFSIVIVVSLVLAAPIPWRRRIPLLGAGLGLLFVIHLIHRIDNALLAVFNITAMRHVDMIFLVIGQYLVPLLILLRFKGLFPQFQPVLTEL